MKKSYIVSAWLLVLLFLFQTAFSTFGAEVAPQYSVSASLQNSDFESFLFSKFSSWTFDGTATDKSLRSDGNAHGGKKAAVISKGNDGYVSLTSNAVAVNSGALYSYGAYVKTENAQNCRSYIMLSEQDAKGVSLFYDFSETVYGTVLGYTLIAGAVYIPSGISKVTLSIILADSDSYIDVGTSSLYADDAFLTRHTPSVLSERENFDFEETVSESGISYPLGWTVHQSNSTHGITETPPAIRSDGTYFHSGSKSLYFGKEDLAPLTYLESDAMFDVAENNVFLWGGWYKSAESTALLRIDLLIYDENGIQIATLTGNMKMLSHNDVFHEWTQLSTAARMPKGAKKAAVQIVFTAGTACVYLDDLFCVPTENDYEKQVDFCDFHAVTETGKVSGWKADGNLSAADCTLFWQSENGTLSHEITAFLPRYHYEINVDYTASAPGTVTLTGYNALGNPVDSVVVDFTAAETLTTLSVPFVGFDAVKTVLSFTGTGDYTFKNYIVYETSTPSAESGWTANELWYPENAETDAIWQYRYFRTHIYLDHSGTIASAKLCVAADDNVSRFYVNGTNITIPTSGTATYTEDGKRTVRISNNFGSYLKSGDNVLAFRVLNCNSVAGLLFEGDVRYTDGTVRHIASGITEETKCSKLNCTQSHENDYSSFAEIPSDWYKPAFDDGEWILAKNFGIPPYGNMGAVSAYYYSDDVFAFRPNTAPTVSAGAGEELSFSVSYTSAQNAAFMPRTVTAQIYRNDYCVATLPLSCQFSGTTSGTASFVGTLPDYLAGTYSLRILKRDLYLKNKAENEIVTLSITACDKSAATAAVSLENGAVRLSVNGTTVAPVMYLAPHYKSYYDYDKLSMIQNSGMTVYCSYNCLFDGSDGMEIWTGNDANGNPILDFDLLDYQICRMLDLNPDALLVVNVGMDAPGWWKEAYPDEVMRDNSGNSVGAVSFASVLYQSQAEKALHQVTERLRNAPYRHRIIGVRLVAGRTFEWMLNGIDSGMAVDYSSAAISGFRRYLTEKYGTDSALRAAWNNDGVTLATADIPSASARAASGVLLNPSIARNVIDFNRYLSQMVTDRLLAYAATVKSVSADLLVGAYYGYLWNFGSADAIGSAHTTCAQVAESPNIDFLASPVNYSERIDGYDTGYMTASESISAYGKLYILEQDNRTIFGEIFGAAERDNPVGRCNTLNDSLNQITRDSVKDFVKGKGIWYYDMSGGWFSDKTILDRISSIRAEYENALETEIGSNAQIAVFVGESTYNYFADDQLNGQLKRTSAVLQTLYAEQRKALSQIGADYDIYTVEDLCKGIVRDYKLNIVLSPFELSAEQREAIGRELKTNGKTILWVYLPGMIDGTEFLSENLSDLVDMSVTVKNMTGTYQAIANETNGAISAGKSGARYGNTSVLSADFAEICDNSAHVLARYPNNSVAAAWKDIGAYTSVYSAVPGVSADFLISLCEYAGVHRYSRNKDDIIHTNNGYLSLYSMTGGTKTVYLDSDKTIYDVFHQEYKPCGDRIEFTLAAGETALFRLTPGTSDNDDNIIRNGDFAQIGSTNTGYAYWSMSGIETENPNLANNGSFEDNFSFWNTTEYTSGGAEVTLSDETSTHGTHALKMTLPSASAQGYAQGALQIAVEPGTTYQISYDLKIADGAQCYLFCYEFDASEAVSGGLVNDTGRWSTNGNWQHITYTFTTAATTRSVRLDLLHNGIAGISYWDNLQLVKSGKMVSTPEFFADTDGLLTLKMGKMDTKTLLSRSGVSYILHWDPQFLAQNVTVSVYNETHTNCIKTAAGSVGKICIPAAVQQHFVVELLSVGTTKICPFTMTVNRGDFNENGAPDAADLITQKAAILNEKSNEYHDLTGDTLVDVRDLVRLKKYAAD